MTDQTPAETLRAAAERLQWLLHPDGMPERIRRPWLAPADGMQGRVTVPDEDVPVAVAMWGGAAEYIAAMQPGVGEALAGWLAQAADAFEGMPVGQMDEAEPALAVSRAILGGAP